MIYWIPGAHLGLTENSGKNIEKPTVHQQFLKLRNHKKEPNFQTNPSEMTPRSFFVYQVARSQPIGM